MNRLGVPGFLHSKPFEYPWFIDEPEVYLDADYWILEFDVNDVDYIKSKLSMKTPYTDKSKKYFHELNLGDISTNQKVNDK